MIAAVASYLLIVTAIAVVAMLQGRHPVNGDTDLDRKKNDDIMSERHNWAQNWHDDRHDHRSDF